MTCREFEDIVNDLVRSKIIDSTSRDAGMSHAATCGRCSSRLSDERALSAGLKSLAASDEGKFASTGVEAALLEAFRAHAANRPRPRISRIGLRLALAAAVILIASGFFIYRGIRNKWSANDRVVSAKPAAPQRSGNDEKKLSLDTLGSKPRAMRKHHAIQPRLKAPFIIDSMNIPANEVAYVTDFFPLSQDGDLKTIESGEMIRVQVPGSALIKFGLPVSPERADRMIKADLLVGEDGMPLFIRFVF